MASCGQGWEKNGDHCYFWSTAKKNWTDAEAFCKKEGAHLASVNSNVTNNFIVERMRELGIGQAWLSGNDLEKESLWKWTDGAPWEFEAWQRGNPNNALGGQHCLISGSGCGMMAPAPRGIPLSVVRRFVQVYSYLIILVALIAFAIGNNM